MAPSHGTDGESLAQVALDDPRRLAAALADRWRPTYPKAAQLIEEHIEECFAVYAFRPAHRQRWRSTNGWKRLMQEIKRRTRAVRIFPNREACLQLVTGLRAEQSDQWVSGMRYLDIGELRRWQQDQQREEVTLAAV